MNSLPSAPVADHQELENEPVILEPHEEVCAENNRPRTVEPRRHARPRVHEMSARPEYKEKPPAKESTALRDRRCAKTSPNRRKCKIAPKLAHNEIACDCRLDYEIAAAPPCDGPQRALPAKQNSRQPAKSPRKPQVGSSLARKIQGPGKPESTRKPTPGLWRLHRSPRRSRRNGSAFGFG